MMHIPASGFSDDSACAGRRIEVLIVDDSVVVRRILSRALADDGRFKVAGAVSNGEQALRFIADHPVDLVLLDMQMPGMNGLQLLPLLLAADGVPQVVLLSGKLREGGDNALQALALGASDAVAKPSAGHFSKPFIDHLIDRLIHLAPSGERSRAPQMADQVNARLRPVGNHVRAVGIGGSTGGISAVLSLITGMEAINAPLFVTQHLPANFQPLFAEQLRRVTHMPVMIGEQGMLVHPGMIYVAPGHAHLSLGMSARGQVHIQLSTERCLHGSYPAVDPMFAALASIYGASACGVILSGMGRDGLAGAHSLVECGGWLVAQDHESSAVWGMPGSVVKAGLASAILQPAAIADLVLRQSGVRA